MARAIQRNSRSPDPIDIAVGQRIRTERLRRGMSHTELATALGVTFRQLQKYERGINRVGVGRLTAIAGKLGIPITAFFSVPPSPPDGLPTKPLATRLWKAFNQIESVELQRAIVRLVELSASLRRKANASCRASPTGDPHKAARKAREQRSR